MRLDDITYKKISRDLALDLVYVKGKAHSVKNCWHFYTDGKAVDMMFYDEKDFINGMNRVYIVSRKYRIIILAFILMDTHVHFVLYGEFDQCKLFMHDFIRRTSKYITDRYRDRHKLEFAGISFQPIDDDAYLKTVICYTIKNAPAGGLPFSASDYPWSSGPLYFRKGGYWSSPCWYDQDAIMDISSMSKSAQQTLLKSKFVPDGPVPTIAGIVFPGEYVAHEIVEKLFRTQKSFHYFYCKTKDEEVDARGGAYSHMSLPLQEMRQHRNELCLAMFHSNSVTDLDTGQRITLAKTLRSRFNCSARQVCRLCGLVYEEVGELL